MWLGVSCPRLSCADLHRGLQAQNPPRQALTLAPSANDRRAWTSSPAFPARFPLIAARVPAPLPQPVAALPPKPGADLAEAESAAVAEQLVEEGASTRVNGRAGSATSTHSAAEEPPPRARCILLQTAGLPQLLHQDATELPRRVQRASGPVCSDSNVQTPPSPLLELENRHTTTNFRTPDRLGFQHPPDERPGKWHPEAAGREGGGPACCAWACAPTSHMTASPGLHSART